MSLRTRDLVARPAARAPCRPACRRARRRRSMLAGEAGQAEVGQAHPAAAVDHHVGRLEVAVQDALLVGRGQAGADLARDLHGPLAGAAGRCAAAARPGPRRRRTPWQMKCWPSTSPMSYTRQTLGWVTWRAMRTSLQEALRAGRDRCSSSARQELERHRLAELAGRRRGRPRPCRRGRAGRRCGSGRRASCRGRSAAPDRGGA